MQLGTITTCDSDYLLGTRSEGTSKGVRGKATYFEQELVARESLYGGEEVRGKAETLTQRTLLQESQNLPELNRVLLVRFQRPHGDLEFPHVDAVHVEELHLQAK